MMRKLVSAMLGAAVVLGGGTAMAQERFGTKGDAVFGADRLFSLHASHLSHEVPAGPGATVTEDTNYTGIGFGWNGPAQPSPFTVPRFGFDYFLFDHFNLGGELGYASVSWDQPDRNGRTTSLSGNAFLLSPRVGYVWMFSDVVGFWLRGGLTYHNYGYTNYNNDENGFAFTAEGMFVFVPTPNFGFQVGPTFDIDLFGSWKDDAGNSWGQHYRTIGLQFGLFGWV